MFSSFPSVAAWCSSRLTAALARYLAQPAKHNNPSTIGDLQSLAAALQPGDVLLTEGKTRIAALVRRVTGSTWSHVSLYVGPLDDGPDPRCVVEADIAAGVRAVPLSEFEGQRVRALRPARVRDTDRRRIIDWVISRIGAEYDIAHAWSLAWRLLGLAWPRRLPPAQATPGATRFICSSLLAQAFVLIGCPIGPAHGVRAAATADYRYVTPRDFESASVFEVVGAAVRVAGPAERPQERVRLH